MDRNLILFCLIGSLVSACNSDDEKNESPLLGLWITESCEQATDSSDMPVNTWLKGLFEFTRGGVILLGHEYYSDSNCIQLTERKEPMEAEVPILYTDYGQTILEEGISGNGLAIEMGEGVQHFAVDAYYTINNGSLCFSDAFTFEAAVFGISQTGSDSIDFNHCLVSP